MQFSPQFKYNPQFTKWKILKLAIILLLLALVIVGIIVTMNS
jgi:hypothetical protein